MVEGGFAAVPDHNHSTWQLSCRNRIVNQLRHRCEIRCGSHSRRLRLLRAVAYSRIPGVAKPASRTECKQDSSNSDGLSQWLTDGKAAKQAVDVHVIPRRRVRGIPQVVVLP